MPRNSLRQNSNAVLFLKDLLDSVKSESNLHYSSARDLTRFQDTSFSYHNGENSVSDVPYELSILNTCFRPGSVPPAFSEEPINRSGLPRKWKMMLDSTDPVNMIEKRELKLLEKVVKSDENYFF
jgi:hypothetical protein